MKSYHALAWRELKAQRITAVLILIAVILSTMMTTVAGQSLGILNAMRTRQAAQLNGDRYATLHQLTEEQVQLLEADPRLSYVGRVVALGSAELPESSLSVLIREYQGAALSAYPTLARLEEGRMPDKPGEVALPRDVLNLLGFDGTVGDHIVIPMSISRLRDDQSAYEYTADFTLTGILEAYYVGYVTGSTSGIAGVGTAELLLPRRYLTYSADLRTADRKSFQATIDDLVASLRIPDYCVQYNATLLDVMGVSYRERGEGSEAEGDFSYMVLAVVLVGALVLLAAGLVIYNVLKIAVSRRMKEYGTLRALGAKRENLYILVLLQLVLLCIPGIPAGAALGLLTAKGITAAAASFFSPSVFMAASQEEVANMIAQQGGGKLIPLVLSVCITLAFALAAALPPARYAARVSPTLAMSGQVGAVKRRNRRMGRVRCFSAWYARLNLGRSKGRTAITLLSLIMSITVFVALQSFSGLLDASAAIQTMHLGDYALTSERGGFSPEALEQLRNVPGVEQVSTLKYSLYTQDGNGALPGIACSIPLKPAETLQLVGLDRERLSGLGAFTEEDWQALEEGRACLIKNPIPVIFEGMEAAYTELRAGDKVTVNGRTLEVLGLADHPVTLDNQGFTNGVQVVVYDTVYDAITGSSSYTELYPTLHPDADRETVEKEVETLCRQAGGRWLSYEETDRQLAESFAQIRLLAWGVILFVGLIGVLNIINTVYTNIHTRVAEIGIQRAVGMSAGGLYRTFLWEGAYYGILASIFGGAAGYVCTLLIQAASSGALQWIAPPLVPMAQAAGCAVAACLLATCVPLRRIAGMSIVDAIAVL